MLRVRLLQFQLNAYASQTRIFHFPEETQISRDFSGLQIQKQGVWQQGVSVKWGQGREMENSHTSVFCHFICKVGARSVFLQGTSVAILRIFYVCVCVCVSILFSISLLNLPLCYTCVGVYLCKILCGDPHLLHPLSSLCCELSKQCLDQNDFLTCLGG